MLAVSQMAVAQDSSVDEVISTGTRQVVRDSITLKRNSTSIVDGLSADEIGDLPALSIAEALESITAVGSQREGSGATEISIRGLGPFLGSTVINGREATNGSGDRSVNFSQFPSELFNKIEIYKTQEASLIEGGVAGQVALSTLAPLDYDKRRFQLQAKGNLNPDNLEINNATRDVGYRLTGSYVDQFDTKAGRFGLSIGAQTNLTPNPEQEARSSSTFDACVISGLDSSSCDGSSPNAEGQDINPETGLRFGLTEPFVFASSSRSFRQNITDDERNAVFGAVQWQPNDRIDINVDAQYSDRTFEEFRSDLVVDSNDIQAVVAGVGLSESLPLSSNSTDIIFPLTTAADGSLRTATTTGNVEVNSQFSERLEEYFGIGGSVSFDATDQLNFFIDGSYSDTSRRENQIQARVRSESSILAGIEVLQNGSDAHQFTLLNFDVNDPASFNGDDDNDLRVREDLNQFRNNTIAAIRGDVSYTPNNSFVSAIKGGARFSVLEYDQLPRVRFETDGSPNPLAAGIDSSTFGPEAAALCANDEFPESDFLDGEINGNLITNIDENGNVIDAGTGNTFLTFNGLCLAEAFLGRETSIPDASDASGAELVQSVDIEEETIALYGQVDFNTEFNSFPVRGNFGIRYIDTTLTSNSFRSELTVETDPITGFITDVNSGTSNVEEIEDRFSYSEFLPSANVVLDLNEDVLLRGAIFRAISRPDPSDLGSGRTFSTLNLDETDDNVSIADFVSSVGANGNPRLEPFTSWNFDGAVEWYPNEDSILAIGAYYKSFNGGFQNSLQEETFVVNGESFTELVGVQTTSDENNSIFGIEITAAHRFSYLPGALSGLGFKAGYNYADSNFEFESGRLGEAVLFDQNGNIANTLDGFVAPANLPGLSEHTGNAQIYYDIGDLSLQGIAKYRSSFFQQFINDPQNLRFIKGATVFEARASYKINDYLKFSVEGVNIFNAPREQFNPTLDNFAEINVFGPRYFAGLTAKF